MPHQELQIQPSERTTRVNGGMALSFALDATGRSKVPGVRRAACASSLETGTRSARAGASSLMVGMEISAPCVAAAAGTGYSWRQGAQVEAK